MAERHARDWNEEDRFWRENFSSRPYTDDDASYDRYRAAYRYGTESATRHRGRAWGDAEPELRRGWESYEHRGEDRSTWEEIKDAARDAWDRVTGDDEPRSGDRTMGGQARRP